MHTRGRRAEDEAYAQHKAQFLNLAETSKSVLLELGGILNQRYRNRGPSHQTQRSLQRKNEAVSRLDQFITEEQRFREREERSDQNKGEDPQITVETLKKQLEDQNTAFDLERANLQQEVTTNLNAQADLRSSLDKMLPRLRGLLEAYDREQDQHVGDTATRTVTITGQSSSTQDLTRRLDELQTSFDEERAQLLKQASDAANTQQIISRKNLTEREAALTCPISLDLFENPVLTTCCGKTFSSGALTQALRQNPQCPVCRAYRVSTHPNRDMANLVELHRFERSVLGLPETALTTSAAAVPGANDELVAAQATSVSEHTHSNVEPDNSSNGPQNRNRSQRNQRVQARAAVPHRQSSRNTAQAGATPNTTPPNSGASKRGRRRGGRGSSSRRNCTSHSSASPSLTATSQASHRLVSNTAPSSSASASTVQSPSWDQSWRSSNAASQLTTAYAAPGITGIAGSGNALAQAWGLAAANYSTQQFQQNSGSYGRGPTDDEFNFYPYADIGYYGSDSDY